MQLLAISVAGARTITVGGRAVETGIYKAPVTGPVWVGPEGVAGDLQVDRENHGGEHLAVYSYPHEHYPYWAGRLGRGSWEGRRSRPRRGMEEALSKKIESRATEPLSH